MNIAVRLEGEAPAGGIVISGNVHDAVAGRLKAGFEDLGGARAEEHRAAGTGLRVTWAAADWSARRRRPIALAGNASTAAAALAVPPPLPDKPSIAVLPFTNM